MKKVSFVIILISSILIAISETSALAGKYTELANQVFVFSAVGLGVGEVLFGLSEVLIGRKEK